MKTLILSLAVLLPSLAAAQPPTRTYEVIDGVRTEIESRGPFNVTRFSNGMGVSFTWRQELRIPPPPGRRVELTYVKLLYATQPDGAASVDVFTVPADGSAAGMRLLTSGVAFAGGQASLGEFELMRRSEFYHYGYSGSLWTDSGPISLMLFLKDANGQPLDQVMLEHLSNRPR